MSPVSSMDWLMIIAIITIGSAFNSSNTSNVSAPTIGPTVANTTCTSQDCHIICSGYRQCYGETFDISTASDIHIECSGIESCAESKLSKPLAGSSLISSLRLDCLANQSCYHIQIGSGGGHIDVTKGVRINCNNINACNGYSDIFLTVKADDVNININCNSSTINDGACQDLRLITDNVISGVGSNSVIYVNSTVAVMCGHSDCTRFILSPSLISNIFIDCSVPRSCQSLRVGDISRSKLLSHNIVIDCGYESCTNGQLVTSLNINNYTVNDATILNCMGYRACDGISLLELSTNTYVYDSVFINCTECESSKVFAYCDKIEPEQRINITYNKELNTWQCVIDEYNVESATASCCPFSTPVIILPIDTTTSSPQSRGTSTIDKFNMTLVSKADEGSMSPSINIVGPMFITCMIVAIIDVCIIIFLIRYIIKYLLPRAQKPGNVSILKAIKTLYWYQYIFICLEIFDIVTDYLYGASLITSGDDELFILGWLALLFGIFGVIMFIIKYSSWRKLFAYQVGEYKSQLKQYSSDAHFDNDKCNEIVGEIRTRTLDIDVIAALNTCLEDIPETLIVLISSIKFKWDAIAVLNISLSILSFVLKLCQIVVTQFGCKDYNKYQPGTSMATRSVGYSIAMSLNMSNTNSPSSPSSPSSNNGIKPSLHKSIASNSNNIHTVQ